MKKIEEKKTKQKNCMQEIKAWCGKNLDGFFLLLLFFCGLEYGATKNQFFVFCLMIYTKKETQLLYGLQ